MEALRLALQGLTFTNLDLLTVGVTIAAIGLLGFIIYISNSKSVSNVSFFIFSIVTILWSFFNYASYQLHDPTITLWFLRIVIFLGVWHSFTFFNFLYFFPLEKKPLPVWYKFVLLPYIVCVSLFTLTPFVFSGLVSVASSGIAPQAVVRPGVIVFMLTVLSLIVASFIFLIRRIIQAKQGERGPYILIFSGAVLTFILLFTFNLILPVAFDVIRFIPLGAVTIFPFSLFTAYAISKHKTFKVKHLGSAVMAFFLCVATFVEIIFARTGGELMLRSGIFVFVLLISIRFVRNIFTLEHITESLEEANDQLKSLDKLKSEFVSLASHQLRSPLTVIKGYASTLTDGIVGELTPKQNEIVHHIYSSAQGLASVVEDFLNVTKIEQGGMKYIFAPTNLREIVDELAADMKIVAEDKHLTFSVSFDDACAAIIKADGVKLRQVFLNLVDNSIKYTKEGFVKVSLSCNQNEKMMTFSVSDSGIGISPETRKKLFTKFVRGEGKMLNAGGSGLGLYLAQEIVNAHKGRIEVESEGLGKGSNFSVIIPV